MSIKILGGLVKGQSLFVPKGNIIRPTTVMLRRKIFDAHQNLQDMIFIDVCAGTGSMGIEAISRGAEALVCVEKNPKIYNLLEKNIKLINLKLDSLEKNIQIKSYKNDALTWLKYFKSDYLNYSQSKKANTIIFFDPPYEEKTLYHEFINLLLDNSDAWYQGVLWLESDTLKGPTLELIKKNLESFGDVKMYKHSDSYILDLDLESFS